MIIILLYKKVLPNNFTTVIEPFNENGNYSGFRFKGADDNTYTDNCIKRQIGYVKLKTIFKKK